MLLVDRQALGVVIGGRKVVAQGPFDLHDRLIAKGGASDQSHIIGRDILLLIVQAGGIGKMAFLTAQLLEFFIHHGHKAVTAAFDPGLPGHMLCQRVGRLVAGAQKEGIQTIADRELIPLLHGDRITAPAFHVIDRIIRKSHHLVQRAHMLHGHQRRKELGDAGRRVGLMDVPAEQHGTRIHIHHDPRVPFDPRIRWPCGSGIG